jgi:transcriptional regulator with XRE-family HTH domain
MTTLSDNFKDAVFRRVFAAKTVARRIAHRIKAMRESRNLSQGELAQKVGTSQSVLSRLERPDYGSYTLKTLQQVADACDVVLWVDFISHREFLRRIKSEDAWEEVPSYEAEQDRISRMIDIASTWAKMADAATQPTSQVRFAFTNKLPGGTTVARRNTLVAGLRQAA